MRVIQQVLIALPANLLRQSGDGIHLKALAPSGAARDVTVGGIAPRRRVQRPTRQQSTRAKARNTQLS
jgi:hypothetical protein